MARHAVIKVLFLACILPTLAAAQEQVAGQTERVNIEEAVKPVAALTTADLLDPQNYAPRQSKSPMGQVGGAAAKDGKSKVSSPAASATSERLARTPEVISTIERELLAPRESEPMAGVVTGNAGLDALIRSAAARHGLDPRLMLAVMRQESSFNMRAVSPKGARGLMQLMPATARRFGVRDIFDPAQNIEGGAQYLRFLLDTFNGDVELALAGYNAGENAVARYGNRIPPYRETQDYVRRITAHYQRLVDAQSVRLKPPPVAARVPSGVELVSGIRALTQH